MKIKLWGQKTIDLIEVVNNHDWNFDHEHWKLFESINVAKLSTNSINIGLRAKRVNIINEEYKNKGKEIL